MKKWIIFVLLWVTPAYCVELTPLELSRLMTVSLNAACSIQIMNPMILALSNFVSKPSIPTNHANVGEVIESLTRIREISTQLFIYLNQLADGTIEDVRLLVERAHLESSRETLAISYSAIPSIGESEARFSSPSRQAYFHQTSNWAPIYLNLITIAHGRLIRFKNYVSAIVNGAIPLFNPNPSPLPETILYTPLPPPIDDLPSSEASQASEPQGDPTYAPYL
jgi:hypothetical protein